MLYLLGEIALLLVLALLLGLFVGWLLWGRHLAEARLAAALSAERTKKPEEPTVIEQPPTETATAETETTTQPASSTAQPKNDSPPRDDTTVVIFGADLKNDPADHQ